MIMFIFAYPVIFSFGVNIKPGVKLPSLGDSFKEALNDKILWVVSIFAVLSIASGTYYNPSKGWIEGVSILVALLILVLITSFMDIQKDKTFVRL